jgi:hypothetical protein
VGLGFSSHWSLAGAALFGVKRVNFLFSPHFSLAEFELISTAPAF